MPEPPDLSEYLDQAGTVRRLEEGDIVVFKRAKFTEIFGEDLMSDGKGTLTLFLVSAGRWREDAYTAVGFPRVFYLRYHGYAAYFPLWALARYRNLLAKNRSAPAIGI